MTTRLLVAFSIISSKKTVPIFLEVRFSLLISSISFGSCSKYVVITQNWAAIVPPGYVAWSVSFCSPLAFINNPLSYSRLNGIYSFDTISFCLFVYDESTGLHHNFKSRGYFDGATGACRLIFRRDAAHPPIYTFCHWQWSKGRSIVFHFKRLYIVFVFQ